MSCHVLTAYIRPQRQYQAIAAIKALPGLLGWMQFEGTVNDHADRMLRFEVVLAADADVNKSKELLARAATSKTIPDVLIHHATHEGGLVPFTF